RDALAPLPSARDAARAGLAQELGRIAGREVAAFSLNVDFAPVLDLGLPESESVLGSRAVGSSPEQVARFGEQFLAGLAESRILGCGKHFPGLGSGCLDSHLAMPRIEKEAALLWEQDLFPYRALAARLPMVMVAHAAYPALNPGSSGTNPQQLLPASLSRNIISGLLKGRIGYEGLVVCDDLEMEGALEGRSIGEAAVAAVRAGCDMLLVCRHAANVRAAFEAVVREAERDSGFRAMVDEAAQRAVVTRQRLLTAHPVSSTSQEWEGLRREIDTFTADVHRKLAGDGEKGRDA
ncbi:MAG: glycoside hydrolase family 3 N-terminal domain-containing protein, partial [Terriglobia bacterium]